MATKTNSAGYIEREFGGLVGKKVVAVRPLTADECEAFYWHDGSKYGPVPFVVIFDDGTCIVPSQDPEGNGPGHLFVEKMGPA